MLVRDLIILIACLLSVEVGADEVALVRIGESWRYRLGTNEASSPVTAWRESAFDDSGWFEAPSGFTTMTDSDNVESTFWTQTVPPCRSAFLRHTFTLTNPPSVKWLILRLDYNDGFVAYLNGQEIARRGLTNNLVLYDDFADYHLGGTAEEFDVSAFTNLLVQGLNVLAIQVHTSAENPVPFPNSLRLVPELRANFQRGPIVQNTSTNRNLITWRTPIPTDSSVEFGTSPSLGSQVSGVPPDTEHVIALTGLLPDTVYWYRISSTVGAVAAVSPIFSFRTLKVEGDLSFCVVGDTEASSGKALYRVAETLETNAADLVFNLGDVIYPHFEFGRTDFRFLSVYERKMRFTPFFFTLGNHDIDGVDRDLPYLETFHLPTNPVSGTEHYYSFDHGDAHFVSLFVPTLLQIPELAAYSLTNGSPQYGWLTNDLASSSKPWKFLFLHAPVIDSGNHRYDDENSNNTYDRLELQELLLPVARRYGVQIIFSGHDHDYERSNPTNGVLCLVTGGGGGNLVGEFQRDAGSSQFFFLDHFTKVTVRGDSLLIQAIGTNGQVFDWASIQRALPPPQVYEATWNTPLVESFLANDGHGNISNQTFNLIGNSIPTMLGEFSNLGRVYVNNDRTNLYIGFEQSMIYSDNTILLFIESPWQTGVTGLSGLGDGTADTDQGVDGLDFLENLSFTNFRPSLACVLGDEYADGQYRHFVRTNQALDAGQGVFRLDAGFTSVPDVRVQQFNRSPQALLPPYQLNPPEYNANFIEVAIPLDELGSLRAGDTINIAAVVGGHDIEIVPQLRQLDTSFLGSSLFGSGVSNVVLGAVSVRLALNPEGDDDNDSLPNGWEIAHELDPRSALGDDGVNGDPDHDGAGNFNEYFAGTDPRDPDSVLQIKIALTVTQQSYLSWDAVPGKSYQLEQSGKVTGPFTNVPNSFFPCTATTNSLTFTNDVPPNSPLFTSAFYRLRVLSP